MVAAANGMGPIQPIDGATGVKDFDVWFFYPNYSKQLPYRRRGSVGFGPSKFGTFPKDVGFRGRRIDVLMRSDSAFFTGSPNAAIEHFLQPLEHLRPSIFLKKP